MQIVTAVTLITLQLENLDCWVQTLASSKKKKWKLANGFEGHPFHAMKLLTWARFPIATIFKIKQFIKLFGVFHFHQQNPQVYFNLSFSL